MLNVEIQEMLSHVAVKARVKIPSKASAYSSSVEVVKADSDPEGQEGNPRLSFFNKLSSGTLVQGPHFK